MSNKTVLIALLDKDWPPEHSFISGMLAKVAAEQSWLNIRLLVSSNRLSSVKVRRFRLAVCIPVLLPRQGFGRILNYLIAIRTLNYQISRAAKRCQKIILFVRNDPMLLLAAIYWRPEVQRVVFQSSFPHEEFNDGWIKGHLAKLLYKLAGRKVDAVTGVSPLGVERITHYCPNAQKGPFIPLLSDFESMDFPPRRMSSDCHRVKFIYIGSHSKDRELPLVLDAIVNALKSGAPANFLFVGGSDSEIESLSSVKGVDLWLNQGRIRFGKAIPRQQIPILLSQADVGMSLIPPKPVYVESSPTKLAEYMAAGLLVLATKGIPQQEKIILESGSGMLVHWDLAEIADSICRISNTPIDELRVIQQSARAFAQQSLTYQAYLKDFNSLIEVTIQSMKC